MHTEIQMNSLEEGNNLVTFIGFYNLFHPEGYAIRYGALLDNLNGYEQKLLNNAIERKIENNNRANIEIN